MNILLLGKSGMLGSLMLKLLAGDKDFEVFAYDHHLDITDTDALVKVFSEVKPSFVLNCAAYTAVDDCEKNAESAMKVNALAVCEIAKLCKIHNSILIHFSTDYVFDGENPTGYKEDDTPNPLNVYGKSKLEGEKLIIANMEKYYIVRTSWLFGPNGKNFVDTIIEFGKTKPVVDVVYDQIGSPTYTKDLAEAVIENFIEPSLKEDDKHEHSLSGQGMPGGGDVLPFGIYHVTNSGTCRFCDFAEEIFRILGREVTVNKISSEKFNRPAKRPKCSILLNTKLQPLRPWQEGLKHYLDLKF